MLGRLTAGSPFKGSHRFPGSVLAFELQWKYVVGIDYSNPLCLPGRLVLEANNIVKHEFTCVSSRCFLNLAEYAASYCLIPFIAWLPALKMAEMLQMPEAHQYYAPALEVHRLAAMPISRSLMNLDGSSLERASHTLTKARPLSASMLQSLDLASAPPCSTSTNSLQEENRLPLPNHPQKRSAFPFQIPSCTDKNLGSSHTTKSYAMLFSCAHPLICTFSAFHRYSRGGADDSLGE